MNKKILTISAIILSLGMLATGVMAFQNGNVKLETSEMEKSEILNVLSNSNVMRAAQGGTVTREEVEDEGNTYAIEMQTNDLKRTAKNTLNQTQEIKIYNIEITDDIQSVYENISEENYSWLIPSKTEEGLFFAYLEKGSDLSVVTERVNGLNISDKKKEELLSKAAERENKWYVAYVEKKGNIEKAETFINYFADEVTFEEKGITNVIEYKCIRIMNNGMLAVVAKTADSEYIIPYNPTSNDVLINDEIYNVSDLAENICG